MSIALYTGEISVLGYSGGIERFSPRLTVRPEIEAYGPNGLVSEHRRSVSLDLVTREFQVTLFPSEELRGVDGRAGVRYVLDFALFETAWDGSSVLTHHDFWVFTAIAGGGPVKDMGSAPPTALIVGPPWPSDRRPGAYFNRDTGDLGYYGIGVI